MRWRKARNVRSTGRREQIPAEVAGEKTEEPIDNAGKDEYPCGFKVKVAAPAILVGHHVAVPCRNHVARTRSAR